MFLLCLLVAFSDYTNPVVFWWQDLFLASIEIEEKCDIYGGVFFLLQCW